jgi:hypothetical protein
VSPIRTADRSPDEMLAELRRRLDNEQLAQITRLRLERMVTE